MIINPVTITLPAHELAILLEAAQTRLASFKDGSLNHRRLESAVLSLTDCLTAYERNKAPKEA